MGLPCLGGSQPPSATTAPAWGEGEESDTPLASHPGLGHWAPNTHSLGLCYRFGWNLATGCLGTQGHPRPEAKRHMPICSQAHMVMRTETHVQTHTEFTHTQPQGAGRGESRTRGSDPVAGFSPF